MDISYKDLGVKVFDKVTGYWNRILMASFAGVPVFWLLSEALV